MPASPEYRSRMGTWGSGGSVVTGRGTALDASACSVHPWVSKAVTLVLRMWSEAQIFERSWLSQQPPLSLPHGANCVLVCRVRTGQRVLLGFGFSRTQKQAKQSWELSPKKSSLFKKHKRPSWTTGESLVQSCGVHRELRSQCRSQVQRAVCVWLWRLWGIHKLSNTGRQMLCP